MYLPGATGAGATAGAAPGTAGGADNLLDAEFRSSLARLSIVVKRTRAGRAAGNRRSPKRGASVEFADFRNYNRGDDLRQVDWNAYARLEKFFVKLFMEEQDTLVSLFVDSSRSMTFGTPPKFRLARQIAGALGYLALAGYDRVAAAALSDRLGPLFLPARGRSQAGRLWEMLSSLQAAGPSVLGTVRGAPWLSGTPGLAVVISDFLCPGGYAEAVDYLLFRKQEVVLLHLLAPEEVSPSLGGDLRLIDSETRQSVEVSITPAVLARYRARVAAWQEEIRGYATARGATYVPLRADAPVGEVVLSALRQAGVLR